MISERETAGPLKDLLQSRDLSQREVAQALSRPESTINRWVNGHVPSPGNQKQLVDLLNERGDVRGLGRVSVEEVFGG